jgi:hypothetical protein
MTKFWPANGHRDGENNPNHRLTWPDVIEIRMLAAGGAPYARIARKFNCDKSNIGLIVNHKRWSEIEELGA